MTVQESNRIQFGRIRCNDCAVREEGFCGALSCAQLYHLDRISQLRRFERRQTLVSEGEPATEVFNLVEGVVRMTKLLADGRRAIVGFVYAGSFLGLSAATVYTYSAEAITPVTACHFPRRKLEAMCTEVPELEHRLRDMTGRELMAAQNQMLTLSRKSLDERVASFLVELAEQQGGAGAAPERLALPMTRSDIADYLGLTIETVSRCLTSMMRRGFIEQPDKRHIRVRDWPTLRSLAGGGAEEA